MGFEELGAALRQEREKRHLSIDDVADQLKINPRLLYALEAGDAQALPHPAYARGFIRSYARFLGIGNDEIQAWLDDIQPQELAKKSKPAAAPPEDYIAPRESKSGAGRAILAILILCALAGGGYWAWQSGRLPFLEAAKESPEEVIRKLPGADTYAPSPPKPQETLAIPPEESVIAPPPPAPDTSDQSAPLSEKALPQPETAAPESEDTPEQHKLVIIATEECWVHSNADKTDTRQFSLRKGDTFALTFAKNLELKLGNAGGVRLRYDGNELPPPGTSGQVKTITFPPKDS